MYSLICKIPLKTLIGTLFFQIALTDEQNECIYDKNGQVKRYDLPEEVPVFVPEEIRNSGLRPSRKEIVQFLLDLLEEEDIDLDA